MGENEWKGYRNAKEGGSKGFVICFFKIVDLILQFRNLFWRINSEMIDGAHAYHRQGFALIYNTTTVKI